MATVAHRQDTLKVIRGAHANTHTHTSTHVRCEMDANARAHSVPETHSRLSVRALRIFAFPTVKLTLNPGHNKVPKN